MVSLRPETSIIKDEIAEQTVRMSEICMTRRLKPQAGLVV